MIDVFIEGGRNRRVVEIYMFNLINALGMGRLRKPTIEVSFERGLDALGYCTGERTEASIEIAIRCPVDGSKISFLDQMRTLAHEMVHARQYIRGQLGSDGGNWEWKGKSAKNYKYENQPWEKEAYGLESALFMTCFPFSAEFKN